MAKKNDTSSKIQNFTAKHSRNMTGAGQHVDKQGNKAPRARQARQWKNEMNESPLISQAEADFQYADGDDFSRALKDIEAQFNINLSENFTPQQHNDMDKIIQHYGSSFFRDNADEQAANDLEMLEYQPEQIAQMIPHIMSAVESMWQQQQGKS